MINTKIKLGNWQLDNPVIPASGTFNFGHEFSIYYDINILGSFTLKGTTYESRIGNPLPRIAECDCGVINSVGLQNPGIYQVIEQEIPKIKKIFKKKFIANIAGTTIKEYTDMVLMLNKEPAVGIIEVNVSCPNVNKGGLNFVSDPSHLIKLVKAIKKISKKPIYIKLSAVVTDITVMAKAAEKAGADGFSLINTMHGARFDLMTGKPSIFRKIGGFSGPAIKPIALQAIFKVRQCTKLPIIGIGGVKDAYDVIEMMYAGANAVGVGAQNMIDPYTCQKIIQNLPIVMKELKITSLTDIINKAHTY